MPALDVPALDVPALDVPALDVRARSRHPGAVTGGEAQAELGARRRRRRDGEELLLEVAADLLHLPGTTRERMFGGDAVFAGGKVVAFVDSDGALVVKLPADRAAALVDAGRATRMKMGRGLAREWVGVPQPEVDDGGEADAGALDGWRQLVRESYAHVTGRAPGRA